MAENEESLRSQKKEKILWITIPTAVVMFFMLVAVGYYYYIFHYLKANLSDANFNKITQSIVSEVKPGDQISYTIYYKNSGNLKVTGFMIKTRIPDNTFIISSSKSSKIGPRESLLLHGLYEPDLRLPDYLCDRSLEMVVTEFQISDCRFQIEGRQERPAFSRFSSTKG